MSGNLINIANLSYKELQALALRYRVPGNIKKQLLIEVLQAAKCGNEQEVDKLLADMRQNRKKRIRKGKPTKLTMSLASTPIHSPTYDTADDYYNAQHRLPYQWVGAEEEIPNRQLDESNRVPQYEEFRQFLLRRIQRDYQTYNSNHNEKVEAVDPAGIMDLRNDQGESIRFETNATTVGVRSNNIMPVNNLDTVQSYSEQIAHNPSAFDYQILEDPNGNGNNASILLRRMLQAPVGADLGEIASPELGSSCRIWGNDQYQSENNLLDNSDTLSANSDVNGNENDNNNWPVGTEYYRFVNNVRDQLILNSGSLPANRTNNFDHPAATGQFRNVLTDDNPVHCQLLYENQIADVQQQNGQQQWETPGSFDNDALNYHKQRNRGSKIFPAAETNAYYDGIGAASYAAARLSEGDHLPQRYVNDDESGYSGNQPAFEGNNGSAGSAPYRSEMKFYQNLNNNTAERDNPTADVYSSLQNPAKHMNDPNDYTLVRSQVHSTNYYQSGGGAQQQTPGFIPPMQHLSLPNSQQLQAPPPAHNGYVENLGGNPNSITQTPQLLQSVDEFNRPSIFEQYQMIYKGDALPEEGKQNQLYQAGDRDVIRRVEVEAEMDVENKTVLGSTSTTRADSTMSLDPFWPQRSVAKNRTNNSLENILNLNNYGYIDYSKIDQTSCIYCYSAPIVTQKLFTGSFPCSQKKRFIAEFRQHTFLPSWLLYNDANTGRQMSRNEKTADGVRELVVDEQNEEMIETNSMNEMTVDIAFDSVKSENNRTRDINDSESRLNEQRSNWEITETVRDTDPCHGEEISPLDPNIQLHLKSGGSISANNNDQDLNLNMENRTEQKDQLQRGNYDASAIEVSENSSKNV